MARSTIAGGATEHREAAEEVEERGSLARPAGASGKSWAKVLPCVVPPKTPKALFPAPLVVAGAGFEPATSGL
jgi:hypothetical protein